MLKIDIPIFLIVNYVSFQVFLVTGLNRQFGISDEWFSIGDSLIITVLGQVRSSFGVYISCVQFIEQISTWTHHSFCIFLCFFLVICCKGRFIFIVMYIYCAKNGVSYSNWKHVYILLIAVICKFFYMPISQSSYIAL